MFQGNKQTKVVYLIGFMGSGKTTIGKELSNRLDWPFYDLDQLIEEQENLTISQIFSSKGEKYFRKQEELLLKALSLKASAIISLGGGTPCNERNWDYINQKRAVYLKVSKKDLVERLWTQKSKRPLISDIGSKKVLLLRIEELLKYRKTFYNRARVKVWNRGNLENVVQRILAKL